MLQTVVVATVDAGRFRRSEYVKPSAVQTCSSGTLTWKKNPFRDGVPVHTVIECLSHNGRLHHGVKDASKKNKFYGTER